MVTSQQIAEKALRDLAREKYKVGQSVCYVEDRHRGTPEIHNVPVTKVGRQYGYFKLYSWSETRFDLQTGWVTNEGGYGRIGRVWLRQGLYDLHVEKKRLWRNIWLSLRNQSQCPEHLTVSQLKNITGVLKVAL